MPTRITSITVNDAGAGTAALLARQGAEAARDDAEAARDAALAAEASLVEWQGPWAAATAYAPSDLVREGGSTYVCREIHVSGVFATDLAAGRWEIFAQKGDAGAGTGDVLAANNGSEYTPATFAANLNLARGFQTPYTGDLDALAVTGLHRLGAGVTNGPPGAGAGAFVHHHNDSASVATQVCVMPDGAVHTRVKAASLWGAWTRLASTQDLDPRSFYHLADWRHAVTGNVAAIEVTGLAGHNAFRFRGHFESASPTGFGVRFSDDNGVSYLQTPGDYGGAASNGDAGLSTAGFTYARLSENLESGGGTLFLDVEWFDGEVVWRASSFTSSERVQHASGYLTNQATPFVPTAIELIAITNAWTGGSGEAWARRTA